MQQIIDKALDKMKKLVVKVSALLLDESIPQAFKLGFPLNKWQYKFKFASKSSFGLKLSFNGSRSIFLFRVTVNIFVWNQNDRKNICIKNYYYGVYGFPPPRSLQ